MPIARCATLRATSSRAARPPVAALERRRAFAARPPLRSPSARASANAPCQMSPAARVCRMQRHAGRARCRSSSTADGTRRPHPRVRANGIDAGFALSVTPTRRASAICRSSAKPRSVEAAVRGPPCSASSRRSMRAGANVARVGELRRQAPCGVERAGPSTRARRTRAARVGVGRAQLKASALQRGVQRDAQPRAVAKPDRRVRVVAATSNRRPARAGRRVQTRIVGADGADRPAARLEAVRTRRPRYRRPRSSIGTRPRRSTTAAR